MRAGVVAAALLLTATLIVGAPVSTAAARTSHGELDAAQTTSAQAPSWRAQLDRYVAGRDVGVSVWLHGRPLYNHAASRQRVPASNQKLLLTMALFSTMPSETRISTSAFGNRISRTTIRGNLWLAGNGDPTVTAGGTYGDRLPFEPARLGRLARRIRSAGVTRVTGSVKGALSPYARDWWAHGWRSHYRTYYIPLPTGLALDGNATGDTHITDPELRAARALTRALRRNGVRVDGDPGTGRRPGGLDRVGQVQSAPLSSLVRHMNHGSSNFFAEMLGKHLSVDTGRTPGSIAGGAAAIEKWAQRRGATVTAYDASGLSYANRTSASTLARLLDDQAQRRSFALVRGTLPTGGQGTLKDRLEGVRVRAKTGTLRERSALSGYVYLRKREAWASFSILSAGTGKETAVAMEDRIVSLLEQAAQ